MLLAVSAVRHEFWLYYFLQFRNNENRKRARIGAKIVQLQFRLAEEREVDDGTDTKYKSEMEALLDLLLAEKMTYRFVHFLLVFNRLYSDT